MVRRIRVWPRSGASGADRRRIRQAVNERAPEDCGALRYYRRLLIEANASRRERLVGFEEAGR